MTPLLMDLSYKKTNNFIALLSTGKCNVNTKFKHQWLKTNMSLPTSPHTNFVFTKESKENGKLSSLTKT